MRGSVMRLLPGAGGADQMHVGGSRAGRLGGRARPCGGSARNPDRPHFDYLDGGPRLGEFHRLLAVSHLDQQAVGTGSGGDADDVAYGFGLTQNGEHVVGDVGAGAAAAHVRAGRGAVATGKRLAGELGWPHRLTGDWTLDARICRSPIYVLSSADGAAAGPGKVAFAWRMPQISSISLGMSRSSERAAMNVVPTTGTSHNSGDRNVSRSPLM